MTSRNLYSAFRVIIVVYVWIDLNGLDEVVSKHLNDGVPSIIIDVMRCLPENVLFGVFLKLNNIIKVFNIWKL